MYYIGDVSDWEIESARSGSLYKHCLLTIAAVDSSDDEDGFLTRNALTCALPYEINDPIKGCEQGELWIAAWGRPWEDNAIEQGPLHRRAWVLQESVLPPRVLHMGKYDVLWGCRVQTESAGEPSTRRLKQDAKRGLLNDLSRLFAEKTPSILQPDRLMAHWYTIVDNYSHRSMSYIEDKLPALSGLASEFHRMAADEYCAGLWRMDMIPGLCWEQSVRCKDPPIYLAPSWSWASLESGVSYPGFSEDRTLHIQVLEVSVTPYGSNPYGRLRTGFIRLTGRLLKCVTSNRYESCINVLFSANGEMVGNFTVPDAAWSLSEFYCLLVMEETRYWEHSPPSLSSNLLLLEEVPDTTNTFRRFGAINQSFHRTGLWDNATEEIITLI